jgi:tetratricopeptide (TPR) repeat protein
MSDTRAMFKRAIGLEDTAPEQAFLVYSALLQAEPDHVAANVNIGTIYYNRGDMAKAEYHYRLAVALDSNYALPLFDLGNVLDEKGDVPGAIAMYERAVQIAPTYADAHYNLALAYERHIEPNKALPHWRAYVKLDPVGEWSEYARVQMKRISKHSRLELVHSNGPAKRSGSAALFIVTTKNVTNVPLTDRTGEATL